MTRSSGPLALAIDVGGTKIAAAAVTRDGEVLSATETPTRAGDGESAVTAALTQAARAILDGPHGRDVGAVGVCTAGPVDVPAGTVSPLNVTDWQDFPVLAAVRELAPALPVAFALDGVALAAAELAYGAARGVSDAVVITVSTGVGGGLIVDGRVRPGPSGNAGHIGHLVVDVDGPPCACGGRGCVEALASGPAIVRWAVEQGWTPAAPAASPALGAASPALGAASPAVGAASPAVASTAAVVAAARAGDPIAVAAFDRAARALAAAVAGTAALVDVQLAVVSGGVAQAGDVLFEPLRRHVAAYARLSFTKDVRVVPSPLGRAACLTGAAYLAFTEGK